jgi:4-hydroxybenzoate polyprenyltransferase
MSWRFDDKLPVPERRPRPSGWFEVACCATVMVALLGVLIALALIR